MKRLGFWVGAVVLALMPTLVGGQESKTATGTTMGAPPGRLIDVGGHRMHIYCVGEGTPTVVIDGGAGQWALHYMHIQSAIKDGRVCVYDRAGLGWSDPGPKPRTSGRMVEELHTLLHRADIMPPLVLVGHSLGGYNIRIYQNRYPEEVGALVLIDSAHPKQWERLPKEVSQLVTLGVQGLRAQAEMARNGQIGPDKVSLGFFDTRVPQYREAYLAGMQTPKPYEALADESEAAFESASQVPVGPLGDLPLVVLTAKKSFEAFRGAPIPIEESNAVWINLQDDLATLSRNSTHVFSENSTHNVHTDDPEAVVSAIRLGIDAVRKSDAVPAALGVPRHALPLTATPAVDKLLREVEEAYRSMDADAFVSLFTEDVSQLDVNRRVHIKGLATWTEWTRKINSAHRSMERLHRGRAVLGDWVVTEIEWSGTVRGEALGTPGKDRQYRYTGLGLLRIKDGKIQQQILYGDYATLSQQLATGTAQATDEGEPKERK